MRHLVVPLSLLDSMAAHRPTGRVVYGILRGCRIGNLKPHRTVSSKSSPVSRSQAQHVISLVKRYDYENYLCLLLLPKQWRFAFWRESIDGIFSGKRPYDHPVVAELNSTVHTSLLPSAATRKWLSQILKSREELSRVTHIPRITHLEDFSEKTRSSLLYLCLAAANCSDVNSDHAASHLGRCLGLLTALRSTPYLTSKNQLLLPQDLLTKHNVSQQDVLKQRDCVKEPVFDLASMAHEHLTTTNGLLEKVDRQARSVFLPISICEQKLEVLRQCDFNVFDATFQKKNNLLAWQLWKAKRKLLKM